MLGSRSLRARPRFGLVGLAAMGSAGILMSIAPAMAQSCQELGTHLSERQSLVQTIQGMTANNKKMDPKAACTIFGKLAANGSTALKFAEVNKDWCQIPDNFIAGIKTDHEKIVKIRGQACGAAAKQAEMEKKARSGQGGGLLGGDGLEGSYKIPKGAL